MQNLKKYLILGFVFCISAASGKTSWNEYKEKTLSYQTQIPGWCSLEKAEKLMDLVYEVQPTICVEVGVFGGSSIYPTAKALRFLKKGVVHAIDPWTNEACLEGYTPDNPNYTWWKQVDIEGILKGFKTLLKKHHLTPYCKVMRMDSKTAAKSFKNESIDILHIDGNHTENRAYEDVLLFLPKLKSGGYLWFDDVDWISTNKAVSYLKTHCILLEDRSIENKCFLFRKP